MYRRVILAYDGTLEGRRALREGALLAQRCGSEVHLLSVVPKGIGMTMAQGVYGGAQTALNDSVERIFDEGLAHLRELGFNPVARSTTGEPYLVISNYAREISADLVVVGHRRQSLMERWWSGSVGAFLIDVLDCSLLIGRTDISDTAMRQGA